MKKLSKNTFYAGAILLFAAIFIFCLGINLMYPSLLVAGIIIAIFAAVTIILSALLKLKP